MTNKVIITAAMKQRIKKMKLNKHIGSAENLQIQWLFFLLKKQTKNLDCDLTSNVISVYVRAIE